MQGVKFYHENMGSIYKNKQQQQQPTKERENCTIKQKIIIL